MSRLWTRPDWHAQWGYRLPQVEEHTVYLRHAPENWPGATALFVSDVHLGPFAGREFAGRLAEQMRALEADLLLLGGDYAETGVDMRFFLEEICAFEAPLGKFAVQGNNDAQCAQRENLDLPAMMARSGVQLLVNERAEVRLPGGRILIGGVDECYFGHPDGRGLFQDARENDARILLSHYPVRARDGFFGAREAEVVLCGHTHGGQLNLLGFTPYSIGYEPKACPVEHIKGWRGNVLVSPGIGCSKWPVRIGARPQIHRIHMAKIPRF